MDLNWLGTVIRSVVVISGLSAYHQESKLSQITESCNLMQSQTTRVICDRELSSTEEDQWVPG